jgi:hypothetical protein
MTYYKHQPVVIVPKAKQTQFNAAMKKHGYGVDFASREVIGKALSNNAPATHYVAECAADNGMMAAIRLVCKAIPGVTLHEHGRNTQKLVKNAATDLAKENLKPKKKA